MTPTWHPCLAFAAVGGLAAVLAAPAFAADWKAQANRSIEKIRKTDATVKVLGRGGRPVAGARVRAELVDHEFWFGTALSASLFRPGADPDDARRYKQVARDLFNSAVHENAAKWYHTQRGGRPPDFSDADRVLAWCEAEGLRMRGHCIFWGKYKYVPEWQKGLEADPLRKAVLSRAGRLARHFRGRIDEWDLNNEMCDPNFYADRLGENIILDMARAARKGNPKIVLYVNDYGMLGGGRLPAYLEQIEDLQRRGVPLGGIGVQGHFNPEAPDPKQVKASLDALARFGLPIRITEFDCRFGKSHRERADSLEVVYRIGFAHPAVTGILMWGFWAGRHWQPPAALYDRDWTLRPQGERYRELVLQEWRTRQEGHTGPGGTWAFRGFTGEYEMTVEAPGRKPVRTRARLTRGGTGEVTVRVK